MAAQLQHIRWTLPAFALIIGLYWYKRRRVSRGDPGGSSGESASDKDSDLKPGNSGDLKQSQSISACDSGIGLTSADHSLNINSPRKQESASSQIRRSPPQPIIFAKSVIERHHRSTERQLYDDDDVIEQLNRTDPVLNNKSKRDMKAKKQRCNQEMAATNQCTDAPSSRSSTGSSSENSDSGSGRERIGLNFRKDQSSLSSTNKRSDVISGLERKAEDSKDCKMAAQDVVVDEEIKVEVEVHVNDVDVGEVKTEGIKAEEIKEEVIHEEVKEESVHEKEEEIVKKVEDKIEDGDVEVAIMESQVKIIEDKIDEKIEKQNDIKLHVEERDSANNSPVSGVLEESVTDDVRSEGSTDSGKGSSIKNHAIVSSQTLCHFYIPNYLVGRLIGRSGNNLRNIREKYGASVNVCKRISNEDQNVCIVEGTAEGVKMALTHIRKMFPLNRHPTFTMELLMVLTNQDDLTMPSKFTQLSLVDGINNDIIVCNVVKPNRLFVQIPTHPSYPYLGTLDNSMTQLYNGYDSPSVPANLSKGQIVAVNLFNKWMRGAIVEPDQKGEATIVRLLDHGGYWSVSHSAMRKIRSDYLSLPFQAIEVYLAGVVPKIPEWDSQACSVVQQICSTVGQAQVIGYIDDNTYVNLYFNIHKHGLISLAEELVLRGYADPIRFEEMVPEESAWSIV